MELSITWDFSFTYGVCWWATELWACVRCLITAWVILIIPSHVFLGNGSCGAFRSDSSISKTGDDSHSPLRMLTSTVYYSPCYTSTVRITLLLLGGM